ncbi:MAG: 23S rRNA (adenine(2503)-C(2))-methyltransferase RlmN [Synergistes sp.]|nr:23S rRNA (adenine(2503)-C(2))-methyltransferase RlmN [Synergistes sp.]
MMKKIYALDLNYSDWEEYMINNLCEQKFRAGQICEWIWQKHAQSADMMTSLSKALREKLAESFDFSFPRLVREQRSKDGTKKFLWQMRDGELVESVLMKYTGRLTACISTQVGCPLQCTFCATGMSGFVRSLTAGEIAGQVLAIEDHIGRSVNNVVYMGMGEPFLNTENVLRSVRMLNAENMRGLGIRHITISTSGITNGIEELAQSDLDVRLAVSLHAADDELRSFLMPVNETYPLDELRSAMQEYQSTTSNRITIEYALFGGVNDSAEHARGLVRFLKGIHVFVNLIPANSAGGRYDKPKAEDVMRFRTILQTAGFETEIRAEEGADIDAACGQLRRRVLNGEAVPFEMPAYTLAKKDMKYDRANETAGSAKPRAEMRNCREYKSDNARKNTFTPSGGFIAERGKTRRDEKPEKERYRSGKMKEVRPVFRGQGRRDEIGDERHDRASYENELGRSKDRSYDAKPHSDENCGAKKVRAARTYVQTAIHGGEGKNYDRDSSKQYRGERAAEEYGYAGASRTKTNGRGEKYAHMKAVKKKTGRQGGAFAAFYGSRGDMSRKNGRKGKRGK